MKKMALICALCLIFTALPGVVNAENNVKVEVTNIKNDIVTVSGSAPVDTVVSVIILNPGVKVSDIENGATPAQLQFMDVVPAFGGKFKRDIKIKTGESAAKKEGVFTVLVSLDGEYIYKNENFVFYSNETKTDCLNDLKYCTREELLAEENSALKLQNIFRTYSLSSHPLYVEADINALATVVSAQKSRKNIVTPSDAGIFLEKVLVLSAFERKSTAVLKDNEISYAEIWTDGGDITLYTKRYLNELNENGKKAVSDALRNKNYTAAQFEDVYNEFEEKMYFNLIKNNSAMGTGHIEKLLTVDFTNEYKAAGFKTELLTSITNAKEKTAKLTKFAASAVTTLATMAQQFNLIMEEEYVEDGGSDGGNAGGGGGGGSSFGGGKVPSQGTGAGGGFVDENPKPTATAKPSEPSSGSPFTDISGAAWAKNAIDYLYKEGIINGRSETAFAPDETVTRAELVKMIVEALDVAEAEDNKAFSDVADSDWFAPYVKKAASAGIVTGDGTAFRPNGGVTREDAALIIYRALGLEAGGEAEFEDAADISGYAKEAIASMVKKGYINGMGDGTFAPKNTLTRAQAAQLIYNALTKGGTAQ